MALMMFGIFIFLVTVIISLITLGIDYIQHKDYAYGLFVLGFAFCIICNTIGAIVECI